MTSGHNGGPPLDEDDDQTGKLLFVKWAWTQARKKAFTPPSVEIALFRQARAEVAGLTYDEYMVRLLDTGRHPQAGDRPRPKPGQPNVALMRRGPAKQNPSR
jgi:hypothetical protein